MEKFGLKHYLHCSGSLLAPGMLTAPLAPVESTHYPTPHPVWGTQIPGIWGMLLPPWLHLAVSLFSPSLTDRTSPLLTHLSLLPARSQNTIIALVSLSRTSKHN